MHKLNVNLFTVHVVLNSTDKIARLFTIQKHSVDLLLLLAKRYVYKCKTFSKNLISLFPRQN